LARRGGDTDSCIGCFVLAVALIVVIGFGFSVLDDEANAPEPKPSKPELEEAEVLVTGDDGGAYRVSYVIWTPDGEALWRERATGVIESEPHTYPINLDGFKSNGNDFFLSTDDIEIEAGKTERWDGDLMVVLKVNDEVVECLSNDIMWFDADNRQHCEGDFGCRLNLWFF